MNHSVQYTTQIDDLNGSLKSKRKNPNIFSVSNRETTNTTEDTSKYFNSSLNLSKINREKNMKAIESFNLVNLCKPKTTKQQYQKSLNFAIKNSPRFTTGFNMENSIMNKFYNAQK